LGAKISYLIVRHKNCPQRFKRADLEGFSPLKKRIQPSKNLEDFLREASDQRVQFVGVLPLENDVA